MRFHSDGPSIPDVLLERCDAGRVVFLCGAGVSLPSGMPTFVELTEHVIEFFAPPVDSDIMAAFRPWRERSSAGNVPLDQIFNLLHLEYGKDEVNAQVTNRLRGNLETTDFARAHGLIKRISSSHRGMPQIVTTNFDRLFETGLKGEHLELHVPPAFPDLNFGSTIEGITYLHGRLVDTGAEHHSYVLSSADFGRAYLSEGWATNFIRHLLERYTVVLVGYQAEDPPVKYLLQGLNHDGKYDRSKLYAFDRGLPEEIEAKWRDRGVSAIAYADHPDLWKCMESWANRADDPRRWRSSVIALCQQDPKGLAPHERGQVAHILRTAQGARLFSLANPLPHPEWICVLDANVRSAKPSRVYGQAAESFEPWSAYGLDDDVRVITEDDRKQGVSNDNILVWRDADESPHDVHRLAGPFEIIPKRLSHLIKWICNSIDSPVLAWWAIRHNGLHAILLHQIERQVVQSRVISKRGRHIWNLILEHHRDPRNLQWNGEWFNWKNRVDIEGWTSSVLREFRRVATPRLDINRPYGLAQFRPPSVPWEQIQYGDLGQFDVVFLKRYGEELNVPDSILPQILGVLEEQLLIASGLLADLDTAYFVVPTCYPDREVDGRVDDSKAAEIVTWFIQLFDRMAAQLPELAHTRAMTWPATDKYFFRKLRLYAFSKSEASQADNIADEVLSMAQEAFWDTEVARELLFLLVDRWSQFSLASQTRLMVRILNGPEQRTPGQNAEFSALRDERAARYARYLELQGCVLIADHSKRLTEMMHSIPDWSDKWATSTITVWGSHAKWSGTDENPDALINLPVNQIISKAKLEQRRDFDSLSDKFPFTGLVKIDPRRALSALTTAGKNGDYPTGFWAPMINEFPSDTAPRLRRVFLNRVARLPHAVIVNLGLTFSAWLSRSLAAILEFDRDLGWAIFDHIVDGLIAGGDDATKSRLAEVPQNGIAALRSRRTYDHAIAGPIGDCAAALFSTVPKSPELTASPLPEHIKSRVERLWAVPGEGADHAVSIAGRKLNWLMYVDPAWTTERFVPMMAFDHPFAEPAWNGFLNGGQAPIPALAQTIKPQLLRLLPWIESLAWHRELATVAAQWFGILRLFHHEHPGGMSQADMRAVLREMSDETRNHFIFWLGLVGKKHEDGWAKYVIPLIDKDWPKERRYRTSASMRAWIALLDDTGTSFPAVYEVVRRFLVRVETHDNPFYRFTGDVDDATCLTVEFPETTLDLMNRATPDVLTRTPYELPKVLALIAEIAPDLIADPRYLRLIELTERN